MNYTDLFHVTLPETALEIAALLVLIVDLSLLRKAALSSRVAVATSLGVLGSVAALWTMSLQIGQGFIFEGNLVLATGGGVGVAQAGILVLTALTLLLLFGQGFTKHVGEFVAVILMSAAGGLLIAGARDLLVIFIGLELLSIGLYILTAFAKTSVESAEAAIKYYLFGGMSAAFLLFGFSYLYGLSGSTNLYWIQGNIGAAGASPLLYLAWILVVAGLGFKVAAAPFHLWAPDTYEGAPGVAAAFIASVSKVASFALLLTLGGMLLSPALDPVSAHATIVDWLGGIYKTWQPLGLILLVVAAASMMVGNLAALAQTSVRRLLAYSAVAHAGYILLGIATQRMYTGQGRPFDFFLATTGPAHRSAAAVLFYVLTYGLTTIGAFGVISVVEQDTGSDRLDAFLGLHKRNPLLAGILLVLFLSLAGIPPLVGFWAKFNLFAAVLGQHAGPVPLALVILAIGLSAVSLYYYLQVLKRAYVMPPVETDPIYVHPVVMATLLVIAAGVVLLGCFPTLLGGWIDGF